MVTGNKTTPLFFGVTLPLQTQVVFTLSLSQSLYEFTSKELRKRKTTWHEKCWLMNDQQR